MNKLVIIGHYTPTEVTPGQGDKELTAFIFKNEKQAAQWLDDEGLWYPDAQIISKVEVVK